MNRVINAQQYGKGWRVEAVTPSGERVVVFICGSLHIAMECRPCGQKLTLSKERAAMGKVCLVLSMQDYNTIAEALLESALDWEHAADEMGCLHQFCARTGDPAYGAKLDRLDREQCRHSGARLAQAGRAGTPAKTEGGSIMLTERWRPLDGRRRRGRAGPVRWGADCPAHGPQDLGPQ